MRSFLLKILGFILVACLAQTGINTLLPACWGNEVIYKKYKQFKNDSQEVNTLFIGTSRVHCHIDPIQFDKETKNQTTSWNIASPGASGLETYRIIDEIIELSDNNGIKTIYLEMPSYNAPPIENASNVRATYFLDLNQWWKSLIYMSSRNKGIKYTIKEGLRSTALLISNQLGLNHFKTKLEIINDKVSKFKSVENKKKGFAGLNRTAKEYGPIKSRLQYARKFYSNQASNSEAEIQYLTDDILQLIKKAEKKGITLVYVLMPKIPLSKYVDNYQSFQKLKLKNRLNLSNPKDYPKFYEQKYSSDKAHLNVDGAKIMTSHLASHFNRYHSREQR